MDYIISSKTCQKCGNDIWYKEVGNVLSCGNCGFERVYTPRKARTDSITPSQKKAFENIKMYFIENWNRGKELEEASLELEESGECWFSVKTSGNLLITNGASGFIGRRGGIVWVNSYSVLKKDDSLKTELQHYANMIGGKVWKYV